MTPGPRGPSAALEEALDLLDGALGGPARNEIVEGALANGPDDALGRLRRVMRAHSFQPAGGALDLERAVRKLDHRTRTEGFRVLHSWNHRLHDFTEEITPVLMLDYFERNASPRPDVRTAVAILVDYYFLHLVALCAMRCWDAEEPEAALDRVDGLLDALQGSEGSGHRFLSDAETVLIYALSQFHPEEQAYERFIDRFRALRRDRQVRFAMVSAAVLSGHLRWGFWLMYGRDVLRMRADNVGDYPWLSYCVATLLSAWVDEAGGSSDRVLDALLQGLAADPWAFTGRPPPALAEHADEHGRVRSLLVDHRDALVEALEPLRPSKESYSPLALHFNFPHNTLVAIVAMALMEGRPQPIPLDGLFVRDWGGRDDPTELAWAITAYSGASVDRLGARGARLVAYDPLSGARSFSMTLDALKELS